MGLAPTNSACLTPFIPLSLPELLSASLKTSSEGRLRLVLLSRYLSAAFVPRRLVLAFSTFAGYSPHFLQALTAVTVAFGWAERPRLDTHELNYTRIVNYSIAMGKLVKNHLARLVVMTAAACRCTGPGTLGLWILTFARPDRGFDRRLLLAKVLLGFPHNKFRPRRKTNTYTANRKPCLWHTYTRLGMAPQTVRWHGTTSVV